MKKGGLILIFLYSFLLSAQPILNNRYNLGSVSVFASVFATDSCYFVSGMRGVQSNPNLQHGAFIKFNLDGSIADSTYFENDSTGFIFWESPNLIKTLDGNFAQTFTVTPNIVGERHFGFVKLKPNGDTLIYRTYLDLYTENNDDWVVHPGGFIQDPLDSSYYGTVNVSRHSDLVAGTALFKISKSGVLLWHQTYYGMLGNFRIFNARSLIKIGPNRLMIGGTQNHTPASNPDNRFNTKLLIVDTLGNIVQSKVYPNSILANHCNGLMQTIDGGYLYAGQNGFFEQNGNVITMRSRIVKLDDNLDIEWTLEDGIPTAASLMNFEKILKVNDSNFVAIGKTIDTASFATANTAGRLLKFNLEGEIIWKRNYQKVSVNDNTINFPKHILYSGDVTTDSGFVMVGQSNNFENTSEPIGQLGWLIKTDKYGCLVPGCQEFDTAGEPSTQLESKTEIKIYPNPTSESLYVYYANKKHSGSGKARLYDSQGKLINYWNLTTNHSTYMIDVSNYKKGVYLLQVSDIETVTTKIIIN